MGIIVKRWKPDPTQATTNGKAGSSAELVKNALEHTRAIACGSCGKGVGGDRDYRGRPQHAVRRCMNVRHS